MFRDCTLDKHEPVDFSNWIYFRQLSGTGGWRPLLVEDCMLGSKLGDTTPGTQTPTAAEVTYAIHEEVPSRRYVHVVTLTIIVGACALLRAVRTWNCQRLHFIILKSRAGRCRCCLTNIQ